MTAQTILIVEDDAILAKHLQGTLAQLDYRPLGPLSTGEEALTSVAADPPDLVLMDTRLAGALDGVTTARYIAACIDIPIVFLTAQSNPTELHRASEAMPYGYLVKPVSKRDLLATLEIALHKHRLDRKMRENEQRLTLALHGADLGMWDWDIKNDRITSNRRFAAMIGYLPNELDLLSENWWHNIHPEEEARVRAALDAHLGNLTPSFESEYRVRHKEGYWIWVLCKGKVIERSSDGVPYRACGTLLDISDRKRLEEELRRVSITDPLTGAFNRRHLQNVITTEIARAQRYDRPLSLIMFDIDHFKRINDEFGHERGDLVLKDIANIVRHQLRKSDAFVRWGGEEFMILAPETTIERAAVAADRLLNTLRNSPMLERGVVTASFGVSQYRHSETSDAWFKRVDELLYAAKDHGRNCIVSDATPAQT